MSEGRKCKICGCTDQDPCPDGCYWVAQGLCSRCAAKRGPHGWGFPAGSRAAREKNNLIIITARNLITTWDQIFSPDNEDTPAERERLDRAYENLDKYYSGEPLSPRDGKRLERIIEKLRLALYGL